MKLYELKPPARQAGMTLLELTVVLLILIALAGMMIPSFDRSIVTSTENSTNVSSLAEVDKWMQSYNSIFMKEPNNMEALINGTAGASAKENDLCNPATTPSYAAANAVYCKMMYPDYFKPLQLTSAHLISLNMAGITSLYYNNPDTEDATFASTTFPPPSTVSNAPIPLTAGAYVAQIPEAAPSTWIAPSAGIATIEDYLADVFGTMADKFDGQSSTISGRASGQKCYDYIAFGIGNGSSLTGPLMSSAPVQYIPDSGAGPALKYNRFVAIYQVDAFNNPSPLTGVATGLNPTTVLTKGCPSGIESAKFIGSVISGGSRGLSGLVGTQRQAHTNNNNGG